MTSVNKVTNAVLHYYWTCKRDLILNDYRSAFNDPVKGYSKVPQNSKTQQNYSFH